MLDIVLLSLGDPGRLTGGNLYNRRMAEAAPRHGARITFVSLPERPFPLAALDAPAALRRARRLGAQVLVVDSIVAAFLGPWLLLRPSSAPVPVVGLLHQPPGGIDHGPARTAAQARLDRLAYRAARLLLAASASLAEQLIADGIPRARIRVVPPGRDAAAGSSEGAPVTNPLQEAGTGPAFPLQPAADLRRRRGAALLCVANWQPRKGLYELIEAFALLPPDEATLHLAGDDSADPRYAARLRERLSRPDLAGRVVVHGPLPRAGVAALYAAADVFVLPSFKEPYGTVYGEAMAAGLPVVGWRAGNLPYLAEDGREGLLAAPGDVAGLARALHRLAGDAALRRQLGQAAAARALTLPTWEQSTGLFFSALHEAASQDP